MLKTYFKGLFDCMSRANMVNIVTSE